MLILSQLNLANGNTRNSNGLDLALAAALANAQQQLNPDASQAKDESSLANSLLNSSPETKMLNLLENSDEINDKMLKLSNYLDALKNGNSKPEGDEEIVVDNESLSDETIAEEEEMADEEENIGEDDENLDDEETETVKGDEQNDQETDDESPPLENDEQPEQTKQERRKPASKEAAGKEQPIRQSADEEAAQPKENGTKEDATESSTESSADEQRFKRRTRSSSLDHQNGTSGKHANERCYETDEEENASSRQIELRKKGRRGRQPNNGTSKKAEQHKSSRSEEKEVSS